MSALERLGGFFLAPVATQPEDTAAAGDVPVALGGERLVAVVAAPGDLPAAAGGIAAMLRRSAGRPTAVVCRPGPAPARRSATRAAWSAARRLTGRELAATPAGALCHVALDADPTRAAATLRGVLAAVEVPVVLAVAGRPEGLDDLLAAADRLVLAAPPDGDLDLAELALASLAELGPPATVTTPPTTALARRAASLGFRSLPLGVAATPGRVAPPPIRATPPSASRMAVEAEPPQSPAPSSPAPPPPPAAGFARPLPPDFASAGTGQARARQARAEAAT